jgi:phosphate transport system substrate-binding protein
MNCKKDEYKKKRNKREEKKMKLKRIVAFAAAAVLAVGLTACGSNETESSVEKKSETSSVAESGAQESSQSSTQTDGNLSGSIVITGSTSVEKILNDMKDEFIAANPEVSIEYTGSGSSAGIKDTIAKTNNIGASSREIKDEEKTEAQSGNGEELQIEVFAYDGIAIIVNPANGVTDITTEQLADIYSGKITNWSELGGEDGEIFVVSREESSGTRSAFEELIGLEDAGGLTSKAAVNEGNGPVQSAVAGNPNAIGYVSFSFIDDTVKALTVGGVEATADNAKSGTYPLSRPFIFCYFDSNATDAGKAFLEFALSEEGQACVEKHGGIRID